jgi:site-specific DNA-methyltransferase (adenine-specific)
VSKPPQIPGSALTDTIIHGENMQVLPQLASASFQLIYIDPPFNTGREQTRRTLRTTPKKDGDRVGFQGRRYASELIAESSYKDSFEDYLAFLLPRLREAHRLLHQSGTLYFHIDYREAHYCKLLLDELFGRECFLNEIIWAYDYGGRSKRRWPAKHDTIFVYVKDPVDYYFDCEQVDREPYMAPGLITPEKAARGKLPTDVWWHTIVSPTGREKTGYPTQKPSGVLPGLLRRQRHTRSRRRIARPPLPADRQPHGRRRGDAPAPAPSAATHGRRRSPESPQHSCARRAPRCRTAPAIGSPCERIRGQLSCRRRRL